MPPGLCHVRTPQSTLPGRWAPHVRQYSPDCFPTQLSTYKMEINISVVQFSCSVVSDSLRPYGLQHTRPPCPSPTPGVDSNSCPLSCDAIQPSHPLSSPTPSTFNLFQHQGLFQMSQFFPSGGQTIGVSALPSVLPMNIQD